MFRFLLIFVIGAACAQYGTLKKIREYALLKDPKLNAVLKFVVSTAVVVEVFIISTMMTSGGETVLCEFKDNIAVFFYIYYLYAYVIRIPGLRQALCFFGKYSLTIYLTHDLLKYIYFGSFFYSFKYFWLIYVVFAAVSLAAAIAIELLKKAVRYDKLIDFILKKITPKPETASA